MPVVTQTYLTTILNLGQLPMKPLSLKLTSASAYTNRENIVRNYFTQASVNFNAQNHRNYAPMSSVYNRRLARQVFVNNEIVSNARILLRMRIPEEIIDEKKKKRRLTVGALASACSHKYASTK
jgi:hypothetical protein